MRIEPTSIEYTTYKKTKYEDLINEFINSPYKTVEVKDYDCKYGYSCTYCINVAIKRMKIKGIIAVTISTRVYLIKENENG